MEDSNGFVKVGKSNLRIGVENISPNTISINNSNGVPFIELRMNGDIYIKGKLIENDIEVVDGMREMLGLQVK